MLKPHKFAKLDSVTNSNFSFTILKVDCKTQNKNHEDSRSHVVSTKKKEIAYEDNVDVLISRHDLFIWLPDMSFLGIKKSHFSI